MQRAVADLKRLVLSN